MASPLISAVFLFFAVVLVQQVGGKVYTRCDLARELRDIHEIPENQLATWVCIAQYESHFNTSAVNPGSGDHGIFQISDLYWCSPPGEGYACGLPCSAFEDDDIEDDVICARRIYREHKRLSGDGFTAWVVYNSHCKNKDGVASIIANCFDEDNEIPKILPEFTTPKPISDSFQQKVTSRNEIPSGYKPQPVLNLHSFPPTNTPAFIYYQTSGLPTRPSLSTIPFGTYTSPNYNAISPTFSSKSEADFAYTSPKSQFSYSRLPTSSFSTQLATRTSTFNSFTPANPSRQVSVTQPITITSVRTFISPQIIPNYQSVPTFTSPNRIFTFGTFARPQLVQSSQGPFSSSIRQFISSSSPSSSPLTVSTVPFGYQPANPQEKRSHSLGEERKSNYARINQLGYSYSINSHGFKFVRDGY